METRSSPSMTELRAIAFDRGLKYYLHLSKPELYNLLQRTNGGGLNSKPIIKVNKKLSTKDKVQQMSNKIIKHANIIICRSSMRLKRKAEYEINDGKDTKKTKLECNTVDPIMLTELGPHIFEFIRGNGKIVRYNVDSLVAYILATGDFSEPETRIPFSDDDLRRIDQEAKAANLNERSVLEAKQNKREYDEKKITRDGILGLERCAGEYITNMLEVVESEDAEEGEIILIMKLFPSFSSIFHQMRVADMNYAKQCMNHFKAYLKGPKNRPTIDRSGLLPSILEFLNDVNHGRQDASAFGF